MDATVAGDLADLFGLKDEDQARGAYRTKFIKAMSEGKLATIINDNVAKAITNRTYIFLKTVVEKDDGGKTFGNLMALCKYVAADKDAGTDVWDRARTLARFNDFFSMNYNNLTGRVFNRMTGDYKASMIKTMMTEIYDSSTQKMASLLDYIEKTELAFIEVWNLRAVFVGAGGAATTAYLLINFFYKNKFSYADMRQDRAIALDHLSRLAPPLTKFPGFKAWGPGDARDKQAATNLKNHFLKHVLDSDPQKDPLDWKGECPIWWNELGIKLTYGDAQTNLGAQFGTISALFGADPQPDTVLATNQVETFIATLKGGGDTVGLQIGEFLWTAYGTAYRDKALGFSANMQHCIVHGSGKKAEYVFLSGYKDNYFIVGRMVGDRLLISSCYVVQSVDTKRASRDKYQIWQLA